MDRITFLTKRFPVAAFCALVVVFSYAAYFLPLPGIGVLFLIAVVPSAVAIALVATTKGKSSVRSLLSQLTQWRISIKWVVIALVTALAMRLAL